MIGAVSQGKGPGPAATRNSNAESSATDFANILKAFEEEAAKTPADRAREGVLKRHGLSEEDYRDLPPQEREQIDREIAEAVRRAVQRKAGIDVGEHIIPDRIRFI